MSNFKCLALKTLKKGIVINPLSSDFWRGYTGQQRSARLTGKHQNFIEQKRPPEFKSL